MKRLFLLHLIAILFSAKSALVMEEDSCWFSPFLMYISCCCFTEHYEHILNEESSSSNNSVTNTKRLRAQGFCHLSDDIITLIMKFLQQRSFTASDIYNLSCVNKKFYDTIKTEDLVVSIGVEDIKKSGLKLMTKEAEDKFIKSFKNICDLRIIAEEGRTPTEISRIGSFIRSFSHLKHLSIEGNRSLGNDACVIIMENLREKRLFLVTLNLANTGMSNDTALSLTNYCDSFGELTDIDLRSNLFIPSTFKKLHGLNSNKRRLHLSSLDLEPIFRYREKTEINAYHSILELVRKNDPNITILNLRKQYSDMYNINIDMRKYIGMLVDALHKNAFVEHLCLPYIYGYHIDDGLIELIADMIKNNSSIRIIDTSLNIISSSHVTMLQDIAKSRKYPLTMRVNSEKFTYLK